MENAAGVGDGEDGRHAILLAEETQHHVTELFVLVEKGMNRTTQIAANNTVTTGEHARTPNFRDDGKEAFLRAEAAHHGLKRHARTTGDLLEPDLIVGSRSE